MAIKVLIRRRVRPGKEGELGKAVKDLRSEVMHVEGFVSGETLRSIDDASVHLVISTWKSLEDWQTWANSPKRKELQEKMNAILTEPTKISPYYYE